MSDEDASEEPQAEDDEFEITDLRPDHHHDHIRAEFGGPDSAGSSVSDDRTQRWTFRTLSAIVLLAVLAISLPPSRDVLARLVGVPSPTPQEQAASNSQVRVVTKEQFGVSITSGSTATPGSQVPDLPPPPSGTATPPGPAPTNCWNGPPPTLSDAVSGSLGGAIGSTPLFVTGFSGPPPILSLAYAAHPETAVTPFGWRLHDTEIGWPVPINLVVPAGNHELLGLSGADVTTGQQLLFGLVALGNSGPPAEIQPALTLDPQSPSVPAAGANSAGTYYWDGYIFLPGAGCYVLKGGALGGGWTLTISAGS